MKARFAALLLALLPFVAAQAIQPDEMLADKKLEARARTIDQQLRCLVCQNENIDDSDADLAHDLRLLVRKRLVAGDTNAEVKQYIVARYGNYVLLKPPFDAETYLLWFGPLLLLAGGAGVAFLYFRGHSEETMALEPLSASDAARLAALLGDKEA